MGEQWGRLALFRQISQIAVRNANGNMKREFIVVSRMVQLLHELDHGFPGFDRETQLTALILEVVADGLLLLQHVQVGHLGVLWGELPRRSTHLVHVLLVTVRYALG